MQSIRRLYLYAVAFVSLETVLWGSIGLARSFLSQGTVAGDIEQLAGALSLVLVGLPVFILHAWLAQRNALRDTEERNARIRAVFLYGTLLATLIPLVQNGIALLNRAFLQFFGVNPINAMLGGDQTWIDNLIAMLGNGLAAMLIFSVLRSDWRAVPLGDNFPETRRLYRYIWLLYASGMLIFGIQQVLKFLLEFAQASTDVDWTPLANSLALLLLGVPVWWVTLWIVQRSLGDTSERDSLLRLVVLYFLVFVSAGSVLLALVFLLASITETLLQSIAGSGISRAAFLEDVAQPFSLAVPFCAAWIYYGRMLSSTIRTSRADQPSSEKVLTRHAGLRRLYNYVLALLGLGIAFFGIFQLLAYSLEAIWGDFSLSNDFDIGQFSLALSSLLVGTPVWVITWRSMQFEASQEGEAGDHARRSLVRRGYLYLILFIGVMGVMYGTGMLLYQVFRVLLGEAVEDKLLQVLLQAKVVLLFALLLIYHWRVLRADGRMAERALARRHAQFPVVILAPDEGDFADMLVDALQRHVPQLPVAVHPYSLGVPGETLAAARAVILPAELFVKPSEAIRLWLQSFDGVHFVIPTPAKGWFWLSGSGMSMANLARQTAQAVRRQAEGEEIDLRRQSSPWLAAVYVLAGLFVLQLVLGVIILVASFFFR